MRPSGFLNPTKEPVDHGVALKTDGGRTLAGRIGLSTEES